MAKAKIYFLRNKLNNEIFYVGSTIRSLKERLSHHFARKNTTNTKGYIAKYGKENIEIVEIEEVDIEQRFEREAYWTLEYKKKYNLVNIAIGNHKRHTEATKQKIREYHKEHKVSVGKNNPRYGKEVSQEIKDKISNTLKGKYTADNALHKTEIYCSETNKNYESIILMNLSFILSFIWSYSNI